MDATGDIAGKPSPPLEQLWESLWIWNAHTLDKKRHLPEVVRCNKGIVFGSSIRASEKQIAKGLIARRTRHKSRCPQLLSSHKLHKTADGQ